MSTVRENGEKDTRQTTNRALHARHEQIVKNFQEINPRQQYKRKLEGATNGDRNTTPEGRC